MNPATRASLTGLFLTLFYFFLPAQNLVISYTKSDSLVVCSTDTFTIKVQNNNAFQLSGASLLLSLPTGISYVTGTATGGIEQNISNLAAPIFGLPDVPANQSVTVKFQISADCNAATILDAGQIFIIDITVTSPLGNAQVSTPIQVETGAILIKSVNPQMLVGEIGDTLLRSICVENTRIGKIGSLFFEDSHLPGFEVSVALASTQANNPTVFSAEFGGSFFESVGNGDIWLNQFESVCFTEQIIITSCGIPAFTNPSKLRAGWGCGGDACRYDTFNQPAFIQINPSTKIPNLVFEQIWAPPTDYCGNKTALMGFKIKNVGMAQAKDVIFNLTLVEGLSQAGMKLDAFRIESSNGNSTPILPNTYSPTVLPACGLTAAFEASFVIPIISATDSIQFLFDVITCVVPCEGVQPLFRADCYYKKECPVNGFVSKNAFIIPEDGYEVQGRLKSANNTCLQSGQNYAFKYEVLSKYLSEDGFIHLEFDLPHGIKLNDSCGTLLGIYSPVLNEITPSVDGGMNIHLAWSTPMPSDSLEMKFCLEYQCDSNIVCENFPVDTNGGVIYTDYCCFIKIKDKLYWSQSLNTDYKCTISDCNNGILGVNTFGCLISGGGAGGGPVDSTCCDTVYPVPGLRSWWNAYRLNLGYQDNDDDRHAENLDPAALNLARRDRFLAGDTLRVEYCGIMDPGVWAVDTISRAIWHEIVGSDMGVNDNDLFMTSSAKMGFADSSKVRFLGNTIRVRYADGTIANCTWSGLEYVDDQNYFSVLNPNSFPPQAIDEIATEKFFFLYSLPAMFASGCLPKPSIVEGDSIFIYSDFKLDLNFKPSSGNNPDPPLVGFRTATSTGGNVYAWNERPRKYFQYSGWKKTFSPSAHSIKPCENSVEVKKFRYSIRIARENMFPFEVRPLARISDYSQTLPPGLELASAKLEYLTLQDSVPFYTNLLLPFAQSPGFLDVDFAPAFAEPVDEGFTLRSNLIFKPNCQFNVPDTSKQYIESSFFNCLNGPQKTMLDSIKNLIGFYANTPDLRLLTSDSVVYAPSRKFEINFDLKNILFPAAPAAWVALVSPSGQASDFELFQMPQNQAITGSNGLFNLGAINGFSTRSFRLQGENISCATDSMLLIFGWGCSPVSSLQEADCGRDTAVIELHLERPELELDILHEPDVLTLCDTSDWFEFEIYNAKNGFAYDMEASVRLPLGLQIVPGTCQLEYPEGAPWTNIADPAMLANNLFQWQLSNLLPAIALNGLPGVNLSPQNTFHIRFKSFAACGFVANTPIIYGTAGVEPCGRKTNVLNKPGEPLNILGLTPAYGVQISITPAGAAGVACAGQGFLVSLFLEGNPAAGDSIYVSLPTGVSFLPGSYSPGSNAPAGPPVLNQQGFQLPLPILPAGSLITFAFGTSFTEQAGCEDQAILVQTRVKTQAFCQSLGAPCDVYIATGEAIWNLDIQHPQLTANISGLSISNGIVSGAVILKNIGTVDANGAAVQVWQDLNGDGLPSANDVLLQTLQTSDILTPGASIQLNGVFQGLDSTQLCGLLFVLPGAENCACDDQIIPLDNIELQHTALIYCELNEIAIWVPMQTGFTYLWQPSTGIACATCPGTTYTPAPNTPFNTPQTLTLTESSSGCTVTHTFQISFGATAQITTGDIPICEGKTATLTASPTGSGYDWSGPGIQNSAQQTQTVQPLVTSTYTVVISFSNGCTASDSLELTVLPSDSILLPGLSTCAGEPVNVLGTITSNPGTYQLVLEKSNGCDSIILQTLSVLSNPMTEEERFFCFGDSLQVYDSLFTSSGSITRVFSASNGCDSTHVVSVIEKILPDLVPLDTIFGTYGQIITLTGPNSFVTYIWEPSPTPPCPNCPSVSYPADSIGYLEYLLTVAGADGCPGELLFRVVVVPPCSADSLFIPNAFTPNGDGANDMFQVVKREGAEVVSSLEIYDRWGEKVYEAQGDAAWDGTIYGKPAPSDVYVYIVKVRCGELIGKRVGDVTLLR